MGAACSNSNKVVCEATTVSTQKKGLRIQTDFTQRKDDQATDKDVAFFARAGCRMHEPLWIAIECNDSRAADKFLELNEVHEHNMYDSAGQTMLHFAAARGFTDMLMLLIERTGVKPDIVNKQLATPLHLACKGNHSGAVKFLLGCGVDVNLQDEHGQTPLLICCLHSHVALVQMLVEASNSGQLSEPLEVNLANHQGLTPLNCAAIKGDHDMVKCLVTRGRANVDQASPKGCTPLIYAGRGGHSKCIEVLLDKKASALKQDNAGGTVLHHAVEKGHLNVLETMIGLGVDVQQAIEIADNAGRTPLFEAVETEDPPSVEMIEILTKSKSEHGYEANPNVLNYSGQTPLFSAARQGSLSAVQALIVAGADPDLNNGELVKPEECDPNEEFDSPEEHYFFEAFKNCMTPLHVASVLGFDEIALYLVNQCGADVNLQSRGKGYSALHLCVLANKPEMIIELLTKTQADPMLEDTSGKRMLDLVFQFIPSYVETFQQILETLNLQRIKQFGKATEVVVVRHYVNADDERQIQGAKTQEEIQQLYDKVDEKPRVDDQQEGQPTTLNEINEHELKTDGTKVDQRIAKAFGKKAALCLTSTVWQHKELAMKFILRQTEKFLTRCEVGSHGNQITIVDMVEGSLAAVSLTCREKVIKVFNLALQLFNMVVQSSRVEHDIVGMQRLVDLLKQEELVTKFLMQSEQASTRVTNKIHEALLDMSYQTYIGEDFVGFSVLDLLSKHNQSGQNHKGLHAQLALLYKLVNSFPVHSEQTDSNDSDDQKALTKDQILVIVLPSVIHNKDDIRAAATKILVDVQTQTKAITKADLVELPDKVRDALWDKLQETLMLIQDTKAKPKEVSLSESEPQIKESKLTRASLDKYKQFLSEKGQHKDWTQREMALNALNECFGLEHGDMLAGEESFLAQCSILLQSSLDNNNIQIYLIAVEVVLQFILKAAQSEAVLDSLPSLVQSVALRTTDTNTRVRKRSVEAINQVWDIQLNKKATQTSAQIIANILGDPQLNERAIVGRLGIFIKKAVLIESAQDISRKPLQLILGKDYEQLAQLACQWCLHKNTKVRQCALKLAVEVCRLNCIDSRGNPFKQRIINMILGLRASIRDPLVKKINEVCAQANPKCKQFIHEAELELQMTTKQRAASYDVRRVAKTGSKQGIRPTSGSGQQMQTALPKIGNVSLLQQQDASRPTIVLPFSEPLSDTQKEQASSLIQLFGEELITCFYSQTWSSRFAAIQKVEEQLYNLDPQRRDAMLAEINKENLPPEVSFKSLLKLFEEGLRDPVLKNYITLLDLIQTSMPLYFRYLRAEQVRKELTPLIQMILQKTSDLKQKVREASINICLYLSHQSPIGPEHMTKLVLGELDSLSWEKQEVKRDVSSSFGNSSMIVSCLNLLSQYQLQTNLVASADSPFYPLYAKNINRALKHSNPQVRKEGESLFRTMFASFKDAFTEQLKDQKTQLVTKLVAEARAESANLMQGDLVAAHVSQDSQLQLRKEQAQVQLKEDLLNQPQIQELMRGHTDVLHNLKLPNPKKRIIAIVEIKKIVQQKLTQVNPKELVDPMTVLLRHLLRDESPEVYMESLNLLKFFVGSVSQHLSALDLHLMIGQFLSVVVAGQPSSNMRTRVASDKVVVFFSKHSSIGSLVVAKEVLKNIERLNRSLTFVAAATQVTFDDPEQAEKKTLLSRFYGILQMLLQQFSIVLLYQPEFYQKCIEALADSMTKSVNEPVLKSTCVHLTTILYQIDTKLLENAVNSLDFTKKTQIKKLLIELENTNQKGLVSQIKTLVVGTRGSSPDASFRDTQQSFTSLQSRTSIMSPGLNMNRRLTRDQGNSEVRRSREPGSAPKMPPQTSESASVWRRAQLDSNMTETGWNSNRSSVLPSITKKEAEVGTRRRQVGQGYAGTSGRAAGFNRNDFNLTGDQTLNISQKKTDGAAMGSGLVASFSTKKETATIDALAGKPFSSDQPMYVPSALTRKVTLQTGGEMGYQPTIMSRPNNTATSFGTNHQMGSTTSTVTPRVVGTQGILADRHVLDR